MKVFAERRTVYGEFALPDDHSGVVESPEPIRELSIEAELEFRPTSTNPLQLNTQDRRGNPE
jgi:hypothetical protein